MWCDDSRRFSRVKPCWHVRGGTSESSMNLQLILAAAACDSASMSADIAEGIAWDDDMSSWSSAFDPLPPPPETLERARKKRRKVKKKKKARKEPKVKSRKRRRRRRRSSSDEEPVSTRDEQMPRGPERLLASSKFLKPRLPSPHPPAPRTRVVGSSRLSGSRLIWAQHRQSPVRAGQLRKCWSGQA